MTVMIITVIIMDVAVKSNVFIVMMMTTNIIINKNNIIQIIFLKS